MHTAASQPEATLQQKIQRRNPPLLRNAKCEQKVAQSLEYTIQLTVDSEHSGSIQKSSFSQLQTIQKKNHRSKNPRKSPFVLKPPKLLYTPKNLQYPNLLRN